MNEPPCGRSVACFKIVLLFSRYFEDVTMEAGVDMDNSYQKSLLNRGTYTFGSSFTVSCFGYSTGSDKLLTSVEEEAFE